MRDSGGLVEGVEKNKPYFTVKIENPNERITTTEAVANAPIPIIAVVPLLSDTQSPTSLNIFALAFAETNAVSINTL
jgi:hypothetical protein